MDRKALAHLLRQAAWGEFAVLRDQAATMTAYEFAEIHGKEVRPWGQRQTYLGVEIDGTTYLWKADTGQYDGWDRPLG